MGSDADGTDGRVRSRKGTVRFRFADAEKRREKRVVVVGTGAARARRRRPRETNDGFAFVAMASTYRDIEREEARAGLLTLRTSAREDSAAGHSAAALAPMSTHAPLESQWNTLPETRSPILNENS